MNNYVKNYTKKPKSDRMKTAIKGESECLLTMKF